MPNIKDFANLWKNVSEVDLRPLKDAALQTLRLAIAGSPGSGRHTLAEQLHIDPTHPDIQTQTPLIISDLDSTPWLSGVDLVVLMLDATRSDFGREGQFARRMLEAGKKVVLFANKMDLLPYGRNLEGWTDWRVTRTIYGSANDPAFLLDHFVPILLELMPEQHLALGRQLPLFRVPIAHHLINETCISNAAYSLSTGIAEVVPVLDIPLNVTDLVVLTKAQAFLVYKLGLNFGFSTHWQDYVAEFGSVIGGGFVWRQMARTLVGLIPVWGIVPKVAVAYAGTYVVGQVVLQWYLTGRQLNSRQIREIYIQALDRGRIYARGLVEKAPHPKLPKVQLSRPRLPKVRGVNFRRKPKELPAPQVEKACSYCNRQNAADAVYCQYCGKPLEAEPAGSL